MKRLFTLDGPNAYENQKVYVTGIMIKDEKVLITKRASTEKAFPNQWSVPGGKENE